jgi:hypothetical protein
VCAKGLITQLFPPGYAAIIVPWEYALVICQHSREMKVGKYGDEHQGRDWSLKA